MTLAGSKVGAYEAFTRHVNPGLGAFLKMAGRDLKLVRARGAVLEDSTGQRYDDWIAGFGSFNLGHNPEELKDVIRAHLQEDVPNLFVENLNPFAGELAARLVALAGPGFETAFFSNSGSEAVEAAIKTAILATGRKTIAYAEGAYHGTTFGALACMAQGPYRAELEEVLPEFREVEWGELDSLEAALRPHDVAAFLLEPIQVESGVRIASSDYLRGARSLCHAHGSLFMLDEVQTGMGRTGTLFAFQSAGATPDLLALAKSLGGGMVPIGATVMGASVWQRAYGGYLRCEIHNSTFGGNSLACRVAERTLERIADPVFLETVRRRGERLFSRLVEALGDSPVIARLSWRGLLGGIALREVSHPWLRWENLGLPELAGHPLSGALLVERLSRRGILAQVCAHDWSVLRVEPPLTVDEESCLRFVDAVGEGVCWLEEHL